MAGHVIGVHTAKKISSCFRLLIYRSIQFGKPTYFV